MRQKLNGSRQTARSWKSFKEGLPWFRWLERLLKKAKRKSATWISTPGSSFLFRTLSFWGYTLVSTLCAGKISYRANKCHSTLTDHLFCLVKDVLVLLRFQILGETSQHSLLWFTVKSLAHSFKGNLLEIEKEIISEIRLTKVHEYWVSSLNVADTCCGNHFSLLW